MPKIDPNLAAKLTTIVRLLQNVLAEYSEPPPEISKADRERRDRLVSEGRCLGCGELLSDGAGKSRRGLHAACYQHYYLAKEKGEITEAAVIARGRLLPEPIKSGRKTRDTEFTRFLQEQASVLIDDSGDDFAPPTYDDDIPKIDGNTTIVIPPGVGDTMPRGKKAKGKKGD